MLSDKMFEYYNRIKVDVTGKEIRSISNNVYNLLNTMAEQDVKEEKLARDIHEFYDSTEYRIYLMLLVDHARKERGK